MQTINLDISKKTIMPVLFAKQGDVGRKFKAVLTDGTEGYTIPAGAMLSVWFSGASGSGNYSAIDGRSAFTVDGNTVTVELIAQMLNNEGAGCLCLAMNYADGTQIGLWNIPYLTEKTPGMGSAAAQQYYTALTEAATKAADSAARAEAAASTLGAESEEHPGCYYRMVDGEQEWLNPPMLPLEGYRTSERFNGKPVYVTSVSGTIDTSATFLGQTIECAAEDDTVIELNVLFIENNMVYTLPFLESYETGAQLNAFVQINTSSGHKYLWLWRGYHASETKVLAKIKYIKATD